jgi:hypothetical protein
MEQKKKAGRPAAKKVITKPFTEKMATAVTAKEIAKPAGKQATEQMQANQFPEVDKIEEIQVDRPEMAVIPKAKRVKTRRSLHPVEVNGVVRMLTKFAYNSIKNNLSKEIILPKDSPFNDLDDCEGC